MLLVTFLTWWYTAGWLKVVAAVGQRAQAVMRFFSVGQLLGSLFAPFRQISADSRADGSLNTQLRAWGDRQFSRVIGAIVRLMLIVSGMVAMVVLFIASALLLLLWPLLPLLPLVGIMLSVVGYLP